MSSSSAPSTSSSRLLQSTWGLRRRHADRGVRSQLLATSDVPAAGPEDRLGPPWAATVRSQGVNGGRLRSTTERNRCRSEGVSDSHGAL